MNTAELLKTLTERRLEALENEQRPFVFRQHELLLVVQCLAKVLENEPWHKEYGKIYEIARELATAGGPEVIAKLKEAK